MGNQGIRKAAVSAAKKRISTEQNTAARVQASMLPDSFPFFPDRKEFAYLHP